MTRRFFSFHLALLCLASLASGGCHCLERLQPRPSLIVDEHPNFDQVSNIVNHNSSRVMSLQSNSARISSSQMPGSLNANLALQREKRFRLKADFALSGTEVDLGSNDDLFWVWIRRSEPKALYFCQHDKFHQSSAQSILPVQPDWLIEAFGLTSFDPNTRYQGPEPVGKGRLRVTSIRETPRGPMKKATVIDARYGDVLEQHLYDANNNLVASALTSDHTKYTLEDKTEIYLPHSVKLVFPQTDMTLTIDVSSYEINKISPDPNSPLWQMPNIPGYALVDLADSRMQLGPFTGPLQPGGQQHPIGQPDGQPQYGAPATGAQPYGAQYGGGVSPASYPSGASQGFHTPSSGAANGNGASNSYPGSASAGDSANFNQSIFRPVGTSSGAMSSSATASDSATSAGLQFGTPQNRRETIVSPPPNSFGPAQVLR